MKRVNNKRWLGHLLLFVIVVYMWVGQSNGKKINVKSNVHPYTSRSKAKAGMDTSLFKASNINVDVKSKVYSQEGLKENDKIEKLPGQPGPVNFTQYGGYVTVDDSAGRALYYYFAEAHDSKDSLPLLLWLNGGPGCSSLAYGAMQELGPFRVLSDGKTLFYNKFAWNYASNLLFLESPAGVGFSYSNRTSDYNRSGDRRTAEDNYVFLMNWLERFPEYKNRDFYISGESYAGHYVPQLAQTILHHNKKSNNSTIINLKGIIIGNAVINDRTDDIGMYDYFATHALIKDELAEKVRKYCYSDYYEANSEDDTCNQITNKIDRDTSDLDIYNIYAPICHRHGVTARPKNASIWKFDPCSDHYVHAYLNTREVQEALHANVTRLRHDWEPCSNIIHWNDSPSTIIPLLREFIQNEIRVWIFSGDVDGRVPVTSTKYSINKMDLSVKTEWHPWYLRHEVGGYTEVYEGDLTFATVRGAGHQVPSYQPSRALSLIKHFLNGTPLPRSKSYS